MSEISTVADVYKACLDLFKDKNRFAQGFFQKDKDGKNCNMDEGYCFCALGAIQHFTINNYTLGAQACCLLQRVSEYLYNNEPIQAVNDDEDGYDKVVAALNYAYLLWKDKTPTEEDLRKKV